MWAASPEALLLHRAKGGVTSCLPSAGFTEFCPHRLVLPQPAVSAGCFNSKTTNFTFIIIYAFRSVFTRLFSCIIYYFRGCGETARFESASTLKTNKNLELKLWRVKAPSVRQVSDKSEFWFSKGKEAGWGTTGDGGIGPGKDGDLPPESTPLSILFLQENRSLVWRRAEMAGYPRAPLEADIPDYDAGKKSKFQGCKYTFLFFLEFQT